MSDNFDDLRITTRLIVQEAVGRNWEVGFLSRPTSHILLTNPKTNLTYYLLSALTPLSSAMGLKVSDSKLIFSHLMQKFGVPVPPFVEYRDESDEKQIEEFIEKHKSIVVKPVNTNHGDGITIGITDIDDFRRAVKFAQGFSEQPLIIQAKVEGIDHRVLVVDGEVVAAAYRVPASVKGDGSSTILELIEKVNEEPDRARGHYSPRSKIDLGSAQELLGDDINSVPEQGEVVRVASVANLSKGGDAVNITNELHEDIKKIAISAAKATGLGVCGVDIMIDGDCSRSIEESGPAVIEINSIPGIRMHHFPSKGEPINVAGKIVDALENNEQAAIKLELAK